MHPAQRIWLDTFLVGIFNLACSIEYTQLGKFGWVHPGRCIQLREFVGWLDTCNQPAPSDRDVPGGMVGQSLELSLICGLGLL